MKSRNSSIGSFADLGSAVMSVSGAGNREKTIKVGVSGEVSDGNSADAANLELVLEREIALKRYPVIATVKSLRRRPDIVALLEAVENKSISMPMRLSTFLKREKLIEGYALTSRGKEVQDSGLFDSNERGLYHIWYTDEDPLLGTRPILIQTDTAFFDPGVEAWIKGNDAERSDFRVEKELNVQVLESTYRGRDSVQTWNTLNVVMLNPEVICPPESSATVDLRWQPGISSSMVTLTGNLDMIEFSNHKKINKPETLDLSFQHPVESTALVMDDVARKIAGSWNRQSKRVVLNKDCILQFPNVIQNFRLDQLPPFELETVFGGFNCVFASLPVMPADAADARQWQSAWLEAYHSTGYHAGRKANNDQSKWLEHPAVADINLPLVSGRALLETLSPSSAWHVAAIEDLSPSKNKKLSLPLSLLNGDILDLESLVARLTGGDTVRQVIYSDRYIVTEKQQKNLCVLAEYFQGATGLLLSLASKNDAGITLPKGWKRLVLEKEHDNHGRYWLFVTDDGPRCWECSIGVDFIHNTGQRQYVVSGTPGFTPKEVEELPRYLQERIADFNIGRVA